MEVRILSSKQDKFLEKFREKGFLVDNFYLTGGAALSEFYLQHRNTDSLDFFAEKDFSLLDIDVFLEEIRVSLELTKIDSGQSFAQNFFFLQFKDEVLKLGFTYFPFKRIERPEKQMGVEVDSLVDLVVNKLFAIYQRSNPVDYIDFYLGLRKLGFSLGEVMNKAKEKFSIWNFDLVQLGAQFMRARELSVYPKMLKDLPEKEWRDFFTKEAEGFGKSIFS